jgi:hypothetical protein
VVSRYRCNQSYVQIQAYVYRVEGDNKWSCFFCNAFKVRVESEGNILIKLKDGTQKFISSVYYVPKMKSNILTLGQLLERGYTIFIKDRVLYLRDQSNWLIAQVEMTKNRMFKLNLMNIEVTCLKACVEDKNWL